MVFLSQMVCAQTDFDQYVPLQSSGEVPADFIKKTSVKVAEDYPKYPDLSRHRRKRFVEGVNFGVDQLLHSGKVSFGNPVAHFLEHIGDKLLKEKPALRAELRFYVLDENEANAFSTAQGVIFVTTGLIAQTTSEAQIAFVLAHEIVHYEEKHSLNRYEYVLDNKSYSYGEKLRFFSDYNRKNELEADSKGMQLYYKAGYSKEEMVKVFDVLLFSELPFEERPVPRDYFNSDLQYVNPQPWTKRKPNLPDYSDYDDKLASHPNNTRRISDIEAQADSLKDWGTTVDETHESFLEIRNICRFEYLQNLLIANDNTAAIYAVFLLEYDFPQSHFLAEAKAQAWLGIMNPAKKTVERFTLFKVQDDSKYGELYVLDHIVRSVPTEGKIAMGLRAVTDLKNRFPEDTLMLSFWSKAVELAANNKSFKLDYFSRQTFFQAADSLAQLKTIDSINHTSNGYTDKYAVLKGEQRGLKSPYLLDTTRFYIYSISDLKRDSTFNARFREYGRVRKEKERKENEFFLLRDVEQNDSLREKATNAFRFGPGRKFLLLRPIVTDFEHYDHPRIKASEETEQTFLAALKTVAESENVFFIPVGELKENPQAEDYNEQKDLLVATEKSADNTSGKDSYLLDVPRLNTLSGKYGAQYAVLFTFDHNYNPAFTAGSILLSVLIPPIGLIYLPQAIVRAHTIRLEMVVLDLKTGEKKFIYKSLSEDPASYKIIEERLYSILSEFNKSKDE